MLNHLTTESVNPASDAIDQCSAEEIVRLIHQDDLKVAQTASVVTPQIAVAVERMEGEQVPALV